LRAQPSALSRCRGFAKFPALRSSIRLRHRLTLRAGARLPMQQSWKLVDNDLGLLVRAPRKRHIRAR
jgi:hypothetical protein